MITTRGRSWRWLPLVLMAMQPGCADPGPRARLTIRVEQAAYRPDHAFLTWRSPEGHERKDVRVPRSGELPRIGTELATVFVELDPARPGEREIVVRGMRGDHQVSVGSARLPWQPGAPAEVTVTLGCLPDQAASAEGGCPPSAPTTDGGADAAPVSDGPAADSGGSDAGAADAPTAEQDVAAPAVDTAPPIEDLRQAMDLSVDPPPPPRDAAPPVDAAIPPDGPGPADAAIPPPVDVNLTAGLVLYFKLDDDVTSGTARDSSGNANVGLLSNLQPARAWVPGHAGRGLELPEGDVPGWISVMSSPSLNSIRQALTISVWVRTSPDPGGGRRTIVARAASAGGVLYSLHLQGDRPAVWLNSSQGGAVISNTRLPRDRWVHLALVYDGMRVRLHADGRVVAEAAHDLGFAPEISPLTIGGRPGGGVPAIDTFAGQLDEITVYDRALSAMEVQALADGFVPEVP